MDVGTLQSITEGNSKTPRLPRVFPQKPQIFGSEMGGREEPFAFSSNPRSNERRHHCLPFRSAVEPRFVVLSVDRNLLLCARCLSLRPLQNRSCFIQSCTFFSGSKRHRRKEGPPRGSGVPGRPRGWHFLCRILALVLIISCATCDLLGGHGPWVGNVSTFQDMSLICCLVLY